MMGMTPRSRYHPENKLFPPHNVLGTDGRNLFGSLDDFYQAHKNGASVYWMDKRHYSAFSGTIWTFDYENEELQSFV